MLNYKSYLWLLPVLTRYWRAENDRKRLNIAE